MRKMKKQSSLLSSYFRLLIIILSTFLIVLGSFYYYAYHIYQANKKERFENFKLALDQELNSLFEENEHILKFFGNKIIHKIRHEKDLESIQDILLSTGELKIRSMTHSYLSFADADGKILIAKNGIIKANTEINAIG